MAQNQYYIVSKEMIDSILIQAQIKKSNWEFPNEMYIEADTVIDTINYIKENSQLIQSTE